MVNKITSISYSSPTVRHFKLRYCPPTSRPPHQPTTHQTAAWHGEWRRTKKKHFHKFKTKQEKWEKPHSHTLSPSAIHGGVLLLLSRKNSSPYFFSGASTFQLWSGFAAFIVSPGPNLTVVLLVDGATECVCVCVGIDLEVWQKAVLPTRWINGTKNGGKLVGALPLHIP